MPEERKSPMRSVERAFDVIDVLERSDVPLRLVEVSRATGLAPATALRILGVLQARGFVVADRRGYGLGPAAVAASYRYLATNAVVRAAQPVIDKLSDITGLTASTHIRMGLDRVLVARTEGRHPLSYTIEVGRRLSLLSGTGKLLAAHMPADELEALLADPARRVVGGDDDTIRAQLADIKERDHCVSPSQRLPGAIAMSVPVRDPEHAVVASLTLGAPVELLTEDQLREHLPELRRAAAQIHAHA